jgi:hypothetical protein
MAFSGPGTSLTGYAGSLKSGNAGYSDVSGNCNGTAAYTSGAAEIAYRLTPNVDTWHSSRDGYNRFYFGNATHTYIKSPGNIYFRGSNNDTDRAYMSYYEFRHYGDVNANGAMYAGYMQAYNINAYGTLYGAYVAIGNAGGYNIASYGTLYGAYLNAGYTTTGTTVTSGYLTPAMLAVGNQGTDYVGIQANTGGGQVVYNQPLRIMVGTFTGFHRVFSDETGPDPQQFKDEYMGRIMVSTGEIATDVTDENDEWIIKTGEDGITIEDALPKMALSTIRKDKRVFGVMGDPKRWNSRPSRLVVNSVGEGGIWVANTNGNLQNGDYIQTSDQLGYGEKQDDDILHNYTVAKATMDCPFDLNNDNLYKCITLPNGAKAAFIACTYHCG